MQARMTSRQPCLHDPIFSSYYTSVGPGLISARTGAVCQMQASASLSAVSGLPTKEASIHRESGKGNTAQVLSLAAVCGSNAINLRDGSGRTPLHFAAISGNQTLVKELLTRGAEIDARDAQHKAPFHWAVAAGDLGVVQLLASRGADVNSCFSSGESALHLAVFLEHLEIVNVLVSNGACVDAADRQGRTPLHVASANGTLEVVKQLLTAEASHYLPDHSGRTPLHCACSKGYVQVARELLEKGASAECYDKSGVTPLYLAAFKGHSACVSVLLEEHHANIEAIDLHRGSTALHAAAAMGHTSLVQLLLNRGANWQATTKHGERPIDLARQAGHSETIQLLQLAPPPPRLRRCVSMLGANRKRFLTDDNEESCSNPNSRSLPFLLAGHDIVDEPNELTTSPTKKQR